MVHDNDEFCIRPAQANDCSALHALWVASWTAAYGPTLGTDVLGSMLNAISAADVTEMVPGTGEIALVAIHRDLVIGSAIYRDSGDTAYLWGMYVLPEWQRRSVGGRLLRSVVTSLRESKTIEVRVLRTSPWASTFYEAQGFQVTGSDVIDIAPGHRVEADVMQFRQSPFLELGPLTSHINIDMIDT
jgi:GNAT superfamily N-acetyltransferase